MTVLTQTRAGVPVTLHTDEVARHGRYRFRVTWCDRWELIDELVAGGQLVREHYGAGTYGACEYFYP